MATQRAKWLRLPGSSTPQHWTQSADSPFPGSPWFRARPTSSFPVRNSWAAPSLIPVILEFAHKSFPTQDLLPFNRFERIVNLTNQVFPPSDTSKPSRGDRKKTRKPLESLRYPRTISALARCPPAATTTSSACWTTAPTASSCRWSTAARGAGRAWRRPCIRRPATAASAAASTLNFHTSATDYYAHANDELLIVLQCEPSRRSRTPTPSFGAGHRRHLRRPQRPGGEHVRQGRQAAERRGDRRGD